MESSKRVLISGAGGFIGHHLAKFLVEKGYWVRGVDLKYPESEPTRAQEFELLDLRRWDSCLLATREIDEVYNLAANMGGIGFIESNKAVIVHDNTLINMHMLEAARINRLHRQAKSHRHFLTGGMTFAHQPLPAALRGDAESCPC